MVSLTVAIAALAAVTSAKQLDILLFSTASGVLGLGSSSTSSSEGVIYRIDGGDWKQIDSDNGHAACSYQCGSNGYSTPYRVPELDGNSFQVCQSRADCVPGDKYSCQFKYGDIVSTYQSTTDSKFWGIGTSLTTFCGGSFVDVNL
jgi:hypothetical protein